MFSFKVLVLFLSVTLLFLINGEVILPTIEEEPTCEYDGLNIDFTDSDVGRIGEKLFSSSSVNSLINCLNFGSTYERTVTRDGTTALEKLPNLYYLNLARNQLSATTFVFNFPTVKTLVLDWTFGNTYRRQCYHDCPRNGIELKISGSLTNLEKLYLRNNQLESLSPMDASNLTHLYLDGNIINSTYLPLYIPKTVTHLLLSNNKIDHFGGSPILEQLEEMILDKNKIQVLCAGSNCYDSPQTYSEEPSYFRGFRSEANGISKFIDLKGATKIKKLSISHNELKEIRQSAFHDLINIQYLNLANNKLKNVPLFSFNKSRNLTTLILDRNEFTAIPYFNGLKSLEILMFKGNRIKTITVTSFELSDFPQLKILSLANNQISRVDPGSFNGLKSLNELDLSGNGLVTLPANWIPLEIQLQIEGNVTLEKLISPKIKRLHLDGNRFRNIESMALDNITYIEYLNIANNPFKELSVQSLRNLPEKTIVNVEGVKLVDTRSDQPCTAT